MLEIIVGAIVGNTLAVAAIAYLFKSLLMHRLEKDMAVFQARLESEANAKITAYQSQLEKERIRLQISYGGIFEKQAEAIIEIYNSVLNVNRTLYMAMHCAEKKDPLYEEFVNSWRNLSKKLDEKRIFLPDHVIELLEKIERDIFRGVNQYRSTEMHLGKSNLSPKDLDKLFDRQDRCHEIVDQMPEIKKQLVCALRELIGVEHSKGMGEN